MFPRNSRLPSYVVSSVVKQGSRIHGNGFDLCYVFREGDPAVSRCTVIVPTRVQKHAVGRNRIKRIMRDALSTHIGSLIHSIDCVVLVKKDLSLCTFTDARTWMGESFRRITYI